MKTINYTRIKLFTIFLYCISLSSCKKDYSGPSLKNILPVQYEYINNPDFSINDSNRLFPKYWNYEFGYNSLSGVSYGTNGIQWDRNDNNSYILYQDLKLEPNKFYKVSVLWKYNIRDYNKGGIYITDAQMQNVYGKIESFNSSALDTSVFIFNSGNNSSFKIVLGFQNGMNANVNFQYVSITKYNFTPLIANSDFSQYLLKKLNLSFDKENFDESIRKVTDFINSILLSEIFNVDRAKQVNWLKSHLNSEQYPYFTKNLSELSTIWDSFCQRASLTLDEVLSNEF